MTPKLTWIGHASLKIQTAQGAVVYVDPYAPGDYSQPADLILCSHEHSDHNAWQLAAQKPGCRILRARDAINPDGSYNNFEIAGVKIEPVEAANKNHSPLTTSGYLLTFDGVTVYFASDTNRVKGMEALAGRRIDYAFFPIDGEYNMGPAEATECANLIGAAHNVPIHWFNADPNRFCAKNTLRMQPGETIELR